MPQIKLLKIGSDFIGNETAPHLLERCLAMLLQDGLQNDGLQTDSVPAKPSGVHRIFLVLVLILTVVPGWKMLATLPSPGVMMEQVIPAEARAGTVVTVTGYGLDDARIEALYLVSEDNTVYQAEILSEAGTTLRFRVPGKIPSGWMQIAVKAPDKAGLVDQMIFLKVLDPLG
jgi:hypothetical protein